MANSPNVREDQTRLRNISSIVRYLLAIFLLLISIPFAGRIVLIIALQDRFQFDFLGSLQAFLYGMRLDIITASFLLFLPLMLLCLSPPRKVKLFNTILVSYLLFIFSIVIFVEVATLPFIREYDTRPNIIFWQYLQYPKEVFSTLLSTQKLSLFIASILIFSSLTWFVRYKFLCAQTLLRQPFIPRILILIPLFLLLAQGVRGSFGHRPANPSDAIISDNKGINELTKNSFFNIAYSVYSNYKHQGNTDRYGNLSVAEAIKRSQDLLKIKEPDSKKPFERLLISQFKTDQPKNLVIFLQESLGAQFVESLGGKPGITPNIDRLSNDGVFFQQAYASGSRSIVGIASVVSGFLPITGEGVVKRTLSQSGFSTVASVLKNHGYESSFIYGGESRFDNMKSWFSGNGFDRIIDQESFENPKYTGSWGVSDVDLVRKANDYYVELNQANKPYVSVIFSTTNHVPFDYPENEIVEVSGVPVKGVENAIKYADHAIGVFVELAKQNRYYDDTVILVIADHNIRVYGDDLIPVDRYKIPALILGGGVQAKHIPRKVSQPDVLVTALDLTGLDVVHPFLGNSVFQQKQESFLYHKYHDTFGLRQNNQIAILQPGQKPQTFDIDHDDKMTPTSSNTELEKNALGILITLNHLHQSRTH